MLSQLHCIPIRVCVVCKRCIVCVPRWMCVCDHKYPGTCELVNLIRFLWICNDRKQIFIHLNVCAIFSIILEHCFCLPPPFPHPLRYTLYKYTYVAAKLLICFQFAYSASTWIFAVIFALRIFPICICRLASIRWYAFSSTMKNTKSTYEKQNLWKIAEVNIL